MEDHLGTLVNSLSNSLACAPSWKAFVESTRGKSYLADSIDNISHTACSYLQKLRDQGVPITMDDPPWSEDKISE